MTYNIKFNRNIYSLESIKTASYRYKEIASISISKINDFYIYCKFKNCVVDEELIKNEFSNFVLALNIKKGF